MSKLAARALPPDQAQRVRALDAERSILVQAPAGSGKTDLLTRRFLRLLGAVDDPGQIVAITFTNAAAAEMRHRILSELERAAADDAQAEPGDEFSMQALARRAHDRSRALGWQLPDLPAQLRITTIDSFCRDLAIQQPLISGFGSDLSIAEQPGELYLRAARRTLQQIGQGDSALSAAIADLLLWRDNNWRDLESQLVDMLQKRDRWMHDFLLQGDPDWKGLRQRLERPFREAVEKAINELNEMLGAVLGASEDAAALAGFAREQTGGALHKTLAELSSLPAAPFVSAEDLDESRLAFLDLAKLLLTESGVFRQRIDGSMGFPAHRATEKMRLQNLIGSLKCVDGLESALCALRSLPPARYTEEDWKIVRACFTVLRHAAGELRAVFAEAGAVDFIEVAQIAQRVLSGEDGLPSDAAIAIADGIHHLLVDESQDTSRRQHRMLGSLAAAWPDPSGRTIFVVGDPMQSIYFFRDADAELFTRLRNFGLDIAGCEPLPLDPVQLTANFRTAPELVDELNDSFKRIFAEHDGSGIVFAGAAPARDPIADCDPRLKLHLAFMPLTQRSYAASPDEATEKKRIAEQRNTAHDAQTAEIVKLIHGHLDRIEAARRQGSKYRVAVLGRTRDMLASIARALREAAIPFRAVELESLKDRPEVLDALALARALLNPVDRVAWLGVLRAPWCGLSLKDLHTLISADDLLLLRRPVPDLLVERIHLVSAEGRHAVERVLTAVAGAPRLRVDLPTASLGTWLEQVWLRLGGAHCVDAGGRANLELLWRRLDALPDGEEDVLGPALDAALEHLTALPDPAASSDCGVQLMTIHKSKGLEFEVVIVPELQSGSARAASKLLSWFERGLAEPDESGEVTEFLVAPLPAKGTDRGKAKAWVDRAYSERESQEMRRILYVAATRAREELHLFARPEYKERNGDFALVEPSKCLLATAWPAFGKEVRSRFEHWKAVNADAPERVERTVTAIAASAHGNLIVMPSPVEGTRLRRLPADFEPADEAGLLQGTGEQGLVGAGDAALYTRHEGGALSRALGSAVHKLLEELARLRGTLDWAEARGAISNLEPRIMAQIRATGASRSEAESIASKALAIARQAADDPHGQWILSPHADAASEAAWTGVVAGKLRSVRVDRLFRAGAEPLAEGDDTWWIVDYKTAHADDLGPLNAMLELRSIFAPQLESYSAVLRNLHGNDARIRAALYYPRMTLLDWWEVK